jgi:hypothetical protein
MAMSVARRGCRRQRRARNLGDDSRRDRAQAQRVGGANRLRVGELDARVVAFLAQRHRAVFGDHRSERRRQRDLAAPAERAAGDRDHRQSRLAQRRQRGDHAHRYPAVGGEGVVDVGEDAADAVQKARVAARPRRDGGRDHAADDKSRSAPNCAGPR